MATTPLTISSRSLYDWHFTTLVSPTLNKIAYKWFVRVWTVLAAIYGGLICLACIFGFVGFLASGEGLPAILCLFGAAVLPLLVFAMYAIVLVAARTIVEVSIVLFEIERHTKATTLALEALISRVKK